MRYGIMQDNCCVNIIVATAEFAAELGALPIPEGYGIGDLYENGAWTHKKEDETESIEVRLSAVEQAVLNLMEV